MKITHPNDSKTQPKEVLKKLLLCWVCWTLALIMAYAAPLGTAFTYSGRF